MNSYEKLTRAIKKADYMLTNSDIDPRIVDEIEPALDEAYCLAAEYAAAKFSEAEVLRAIDEACSILDETDIDQDQYPEIGYYLGQAYWVIDRKDVA